VSVHALVAVLETKFPNLRMKMLMVCLANAHNSATGACFPPLERLVRESSMPRSTVKKWLGQLEAQGYISKVLSYDPTTGRQLANSYRLLCLEEGSPGDRTEGSPGDRGRGHPVTGEGPPGDRTEGSPGDRGRGHPVTGGGVTLVTPSKEDTGINIKKRARAGEAQPTTRSVSSIETPELFAECVRLRGTSPPTTAKGAWFFPVPIVEEATANLRRGAGGAVAGAFEKGSKR
jgi:hypothetical protein